MAVRVALGPTLDVAHPDTFAAGLAQHGQRECAIRVIMNKKASGKQTGTYDQLVEVALCYGWIDGLIGGLDAERYTQRGTLRRPKSSWTATNRNLARRLIAAGGF